MTIVTLKDALDFAHASAVTAFDQRSEFDDSFIAFYENIVDTLEDDGVEEYTSKALLVYMKKFIELVEK